MKKHCVATLVAACSLVMASAGGEALGAGVPKTQNDFCSIVSSTHNEWSAEVGKPAYIDQQENANAIKQKGKQKLQELSAENSGIFEGWQGVISTISVDADASTAGLSVEFSCDTPDWPQKLHKPVLYNTDAFEGQTPGIQKGTPTYEALRKFKQGDAVVVAGRFIAFDHFLDTAADTQSSRSLVFFEGVGQTLDESMAVAWQSRRQELAQMKEKQEQELAQMREKQEQEQAEREKQGQEAQKQKAAEDKRKQDAARQRERQELDQSPKSHEWYMENPRALDAKLKECRDKTGVTDCPSAYQAKRRIDDGDLLRYKSVEWWMSNTKQRNAKLLECGRMALPGMNVDCRNATTAEDRVLRRQLRQR